MGKIIDIRRYMGGKGLPYDAEVEWLKSTGTQYIDTEINGSSNATIRLKCLYYASSSTQSYGFIFGSRIANNNKHYNIIHSYLNNFRFGSSNSNSWKNSADMVVTFDNTAAANVMKVYNTSDALVTTLTASFSSFDNNLPLYLFANNNNGSASIATKSCIYYCEIYQNGILVRDFIPVRVGTTGFMYDKVSGQLFGNAGSGAFTIGADVGGG